MPRAEGKERAAIPAAMSGTTTSPRMGEARTRCTQDSLSGWPEKPLQAPCWSDNVVGHGGDGSRRPSACHPEVLGWIGNECDGAGPGLYSASGV